MEVVSGHVCRKKHWNSSKRTKVGLMRGGEKSSTCSELGKQRRPLVSLHRDQWDSAQSTWEHPYLVVNTHVYRPRMLLSNYSKTCVSN